MRTNSPHRRRRAMMSKTLVETLESRVLLAGDIDLTGYTQTFADEFNGSSVDVTTTTPKGGHTWYYWPPYGGAGGYSASQWDAAAFSASGGIMQDKAFKDSGGNWHSGNLSSMDESGIGFAQQYGYFEINAKMPSSGTGAWPAFWLMSKNSILNNLNGTSLPNEEIDVFEWYGTTFTNNQSVIQQASHNWIPSNPGGEMYSPATPMPGGAFPWQDFHTYGVQVDPTYLTWYIDGVQTNRVATPTANITSPFYIMIDYALGGGWPLSGMVENSHLDVDWVRVYSLPSTPTAPAAPSNLTATATSSSQINLTWTDNSSNETGFKIERATNSSFTQNLTLVTTAAANATSYSNTSLSAGTTYYYRVRATNTAGDSANSGTANATTQSGGGGGASIGIDFSGAGTAIPATTLAGVIPQANWNNQSVATGSDSTITDNTGTNISGLSASWGSNGANALYGFGNNQFTATDPNQTGDKNLFSSSLMTYGSGVGSGYEGHITVTGVPYASYNVYAYFEGGAGQVNLNGTASGGFVSGGTTYTFSGTNVTNFVAATGAGGQADYALFTGVTGSSFTLWDQQGSAGGLVGVQIVQTGSSGPAAPSGLTATAVSSSQINLSWTDNASNETGFKIERKTGIGGTYAQIATVGANVSTYSNNTGLSPSTQYYYRVRANNTSGDSAYSNEANATTQSSSGGNSIGIDFSGAGTAIPATTLAGFVPQSHWNNLSTATGSTSSLVDNTGTSMSGLSASWGSNGANALYAFGNSQFTAGDPNQTGDKDLFSSSLMTFGSGVGSGYQGHITVSGITYGSYNVYAYFEGGAGQVNLNGTQSGGFVAGGTTYTFSGTNVTNFVAATGAGGAADYAVFTGVTGSSFTIWDQQGSAGGLVGIQIVKVS